MQPGLRIHALSQKEGPLPRSECGLSSNTQKRMVQGADKTKDFTGKGRPGGGQQGEGSWENHSATRLAASGFMGLGALLGGAQTSQLRWMQHQDPGRLIISSHGPLPGSSQLVVRAAPRCFSGPPCKWLLACLAQVGGFSVLVNGARTEAQMKCLTGGGTASSKSA